jgi:hypothetical protein
MADTWPIDKLVAPTTSPTVIDRMVEKSAIDDNLRAKAVLYCRNKE